MNHVRAISLGLFLPVALMLASCATVPTVEADGGVPVTAPPVEPEDPERVFDDQWGGSGGSWTLNSAGCVEASVLEAATSVDGLETKGGSSPEVGNCLYSNSADDYAIGYYYFSADTASVDPAPENASEVPSLGPGARTLAQTVFKPEGCIFVVPMTGIQDYFLGLTANGAGKSSDEMCVDGLAYLRAIATQGSYTEPPAAPAEPTCGVLDPVLNEIGQAVIDGMTVIADTYFGGDVDAAYNWAYQDCDAYWE